MDYLAKVYAEILEISKRLFKQKKNKDFSKAFGVTRKRSEHLLSWVHLILKNYLPLTKALFLQHSMAGTLSIYWIVCKSLQKQTIFWIPVKFSNKLNFRLISCLLILKLNLLKQILRNIPVVENAFSKIQKQPSTGVLKKKFSENMLPIYMRTPISIKVAL